MSLPTPSPPTDHSANPSTSRPPMPVEPAPASDGVGRAGFVVNARAHNYERSRKKGRFTDEGEGPETSKSHAKVTREFAEVTRDIKLTGVRLSSSAPSSRPRPTTVSRPEGGATDCGTDKPQLTTLKDPLAHDWKPITKLDHYELRASKLKKEE